MTSYLYDDVTASIMIGTMKRNQRKLVQKTKEGGQNFDKSSEKGVLLVVKTKLNITKYVTNLGGRSFVQKCDKSGKRKGGQDKYQINIDSNF